ncbi:FadR/GntR family transcriptional regulator [Pedobacter agri]|uniref:FadR/GntR family transcriptional regulator n=1 Tax=Pedobacter agri TaxID=454586 RepID=UPI00292EAB6C|nr:FadR/GntR family transcriptional regulator [Pedobacter agri]
MNNKIVRKSLSEVVSETLYQQIISGKYSIDQQLPTEPEMTAEFGVGRSTIREAIRKLENTGIVRVKQGVGTFVASKNALTEPLSKRLQNAAQKDIEEVRNLLELKIVEKATLNRTEQDLKIIKKALQKRNEAADKQDLKTWLEEDINFHVSIAEASKNPILSELYKTFAEQQLKASIVQTYAEHFSMHRLTQWHEKLVVAIEEKSIEKANRAIFEMHKEQ